MFRQDFTCPALLEDFVQHLPRTGLSPAMADFPDGSALFQQGTGLVPRSLATTNGVSVDVLSSGY